MNTATVPTSPITVDHCIIIIKLLMEDNDLDLLSASLQLKNILTTNVDYAISELRQEAQNNGGLLPR